MIMQRWEYMYMLLEGNEEPTNGWTQLGTEGWELVTVTPENKDNFGVAYFKRPLGPAEVTT